MADRIIHPIGRETTHREVIEVRERRHPRHVHDIHNHYLEHEHEESVISSARPRFIAYTTVAPTTVTIPCHHIRIGDHLLLQGHPCQVIRISTSEATGQHRYLGVDLFTKQLHEESSQVHNPAPSVVVQTMRGPIMKQYRVLDLQDGTSRSSLLSHLQKYSFEADWVPRSCCHDRDRRRQAGPRRQRTG